MSKKPFLVLTNNGERLIVWNIVRNGSLRSNVVFEKGAILEFGVSKSSIWKRTTSRDKWFFFSHYYPATLMTNWAKIFARLLFLQTCRKPSQNHWTTLYWDVFYVRITVIIFFLKNYVTSEGAVLSTALHCISLPSKLPTLSGALCLNYILKKKTPAMNV